MEEPELNLEIAIISKSAPVVFVAPLVPPFAVPEFMGVLATKAIPVPEITTLFDRAVCGMLLVALNCQVPALDGVLAVNDNVPPLAVKLVIVDDPESGLCHVADVMLVGAVPVYVPVQAVVALTDALAHVKANTGGLTTGPIALGCHGNAKAGNAHKRSANPHFMLMHHLRSE